VQLPQVKKYDANQYTLGGETTFMDGRGSVELRLPFVTTLASKNTLSVASITSVGTTPVPGDPNGNVALNTVTTPGNTLGHEDTEFGNMTVILKGLIYKDCDSGWAFSGGVAVGIPTQQDAAVSVVDYGGGTASEPVSTIQRLRQIQIANETWSLSPFLAALWTPNDRFFAQGFVQADLPLNSSTVTYTDQFTRGFPPSAAAALPPPPLGTLNPPFTVRGSVDEQTLLHIDWGFGYWIYRDRECSGWLTGIAPTLEVHYTTTLENADVLQLPGNSTVVAPVITNNTLTAFAHETGPVVGGSRNRVDIVDLTAGTTFELGRQATLAAAVTVPLTSGLNRTFDWEFQLQFNYYFGRPSTPPTLY
jgi:hypothetical protein